MFDNPRSLRNDPEAEFTVGLVQHVLRWLKVAIDFGLVDHTKEKGKVERVGGVDS